MSKLNEEVGSIISDGLIFLIEKDSIDFIELIFKIPNLKLNSGELLHIAVQKKRYDFLRLMCQSEAIEINSVYLGITALGAACRNQDYYMAKELLKYDGIDVNIGEKRHIELCQSKLVFDLMYDRKDIDLFFGDFKIFETKDIVFFLKFVKDPRFIDLTNEQTNTIIIKFLKVKRENYDLWKLYRFLHERKDFYLSDEATKIFLKATVYSNEFKLFNLMIEETKFILTKEIVDENTIEVIIINSKKDFTFYFLEHCQDLNVNFLFGDKKFTPLGYCMKYLKLDVFKALLNYESIDVNYELKLFSNACKANKGEMFYDYYKLILSLPSYKITAAHLWNLCSKPMFQSYANKFVEDLTIDINEIYLV